MGDSLAKAAPEATPRRIAMLIAWRMLRVHCFVMTLFLNLGRIWTIARRMGFVGIGGLGVPVQAKAFIVNAGFSKYQPGRIH